MAQSQTKHRLRAEDVEDLAVIAALMQDATTRIADMAYDPAERTFMLAAERFRREAEPVDGKLTQIDVALVFGCIKTVQHRGMITEDPGSPLTMLTIATEPGQDTLYRIALVFDGGGEIRLTSDCMHCRFEEFGEPVVSDQSPADHFGPDSDGIDGDGLGPTN